MVDDPKNNPDADATPETDDGATTELPREELLAGSNDAEKTSEIEPLNAGAEGEGEKSLDQAAATRVIPVDEAVGGKSDAGALEQDDLPTPVALERPPELEQQAAETQVHRKPESTVPTEEDEKPTVMAGLDADEVTQGGAEAHATRIAEPEEVEYEEEYDDDKPTTVTGLGAANVTSLGNDDIDKPTTAGGINLDEVAKGADPTRISGAPPSEPGDSDPAAETMVQRGPPTTTAPGGAAKKPRRKRKPPEETPLPEPIPDTLPGEKNEIPPAPPYSLRPSEVTDATVGGETLGAAVRARGPRKLPWIAGGAVMGAAVFAAAYFLPPPTVSYPFPPVEAREVGGLERLTIKSLAWDGWKLDGSYFLGVTEGADGRARIHFYNVGIEEPSLVTMQIETASDLAPQYPALIADGWIKGPVVAFDSKSSTRNYINWHSLGAANVEWQGSDKTNSAPGGVLPAGWPAPIAPRGQPIQIQSLLASARTKYPPVRLEDMHEEARNWFLVIAKIDEDEADSLYVYEVDGDEAESVPLMPWGEAQSEQSIGPPISYFDKEADENVVMIAGTAGVRLYRLNRRDGSLIALEEDSEGAAAFAESWDASDEAAWTRARFGEGRVGWILANGNRFAAIERIGPARIKLLSERAYSENESRPSRSAPIVRSFPSRENPGRDAALIVQEGEHRGIWIDAPDDANGRMEIVPLTGESTRYVQWGLASADFNGDGIWDFIGANRFGEFWVLDGDTRLSVPIAASTDIPEAGSPIYWRKTSETLDAIYFSQVDAPVRVSFVIPKPIGEEAGMANAAELAIKDWEWREGRSPL